MAILRQVASPTMDGPALRAWAENKIAVLQRAQASGRVFEDWVSNNNEVPRGAKRDQLQKDMLAAADAVGSDPGQVQLPGREEIVEDTLPRGVTEDDITTTMKANNMTRQQVLDWLEANP